MYVYSTGEKAYIGNKSDTKPPGQSGDILVEIDKDLDVRKVYKYDGSSWILKNTVDNHGSINDDVQVTSELDGVYTQLGDIVTVNSHIIDYTYYPDGAVQTVTEKDSSNNVIKTVTYSYNVAGDVSSSVTVMNGKTVTATYNYDVSGNITSISNVIS